MADLDSLNIRISASTADANKAIDKLVSNLGRLNSALNNFSNGSKFQQGLENLAGGFNSLSNSINAIDLDKVKGLKSIISSLKSVQKAFANIGGDNASSEMAQMSDEAKDLAQQLATDWTINSREGVQQLTEAVQNYLDTVRSGGDISEAEDGVRSIIAQYSQLGSTIANTTSAIRDFVSAQNIAFEDSKSIDNFGDDAKSIRAQLGVGTRTRGNKQGMGGYTTPIELASELNSNFGTNIDTSNEVSAIQGIVDALNLEKSAVDSLNQSFMASRDGQAYLTSSMNNLAQEAQNVQAPLQSVNATAQQMGDAQQGSTNGITNLANALQTLSNVQPVQIANSLQTVAQSVAKLGSASAQTATAGMSQLAQGLQQLGSVTAQFQNVNFDALQSMIDSIRKLGSKSASGATTNLKTLAADLQQLASVKIDGSNVANVAELASAIARFGYSSAQKAPENIRNIADAFSQLIHTLQGAGSVDQSVIDLANAMSSLASQGQRMGSATSSLFSGLSRSFSGGSGGIFGGFINGIKNAYKKIGDFGNNVSNLRKRLGDFKKGLDGFFNPFEKSTFSLASAFGKLYANCFLLFRGFGLIKKAINIASDLTEVQNVVDTVFGSASKDVEEFAQNAISQLGMSELTAKQTASVFQSMGKNMGISAKQAGDAATFLADKWGENATEYNKTADSMADMSLNLTRLAGDMASFYNMDIDDVAEDLQSVFTGQTRPLRQYGLDLTQATLKEWALKNGMDADIQSMSQAEKTMLRYQYVMANTTAAQGDFIKTMDTWANVIRTIQQQFIQLGKIIGTAFINAFKPIAIAFRNVMNSVLKIAEKAMNALGKIFGWQVEIQEVGLTDSTAGIADGLDDAAGGADDTAKGLGKANKNAKELKRTILGFDELNVLQDNKDKDNDSGSGKDKGAGGGAGGGGGVTGGGARLIKKKFQSDIDSLFDLGKYLSDALRRALAGIDWNKIYDAARGFGAGLASFLNGLLDVETFKEIGKTLAGILNTIMEGLNSFAYTFDFKNLGDCLEAGLEYMLRGIHWNLFSNMLTNWAKGIGDLLNHLFTPDMFNIAGQSVANGINGIVDGFNALVTRIHFYDIGDALRQGLETMLDGIDWDSIYKAVGGFGTGLADFLNGLIRPSLFGKVGKTIANALNSALEFLDDFGTRFSWKDFGNSIAEGINQFFKNFKWSKLASTLNTWAKGLLDALIRALKKTDWKMIGQKIGEFLSDIDFLEIGKKVGQAIWKAINAGFEIYIGMFQSAPLETALLTLVGIPKLLKVDGIKNFADAISGANDKVNLFATAIKMGYSPVESLTLAFPKLGGAVSAVKDGFSEFTFELDNGLGVFTSVGDGLETIGSKMTPVQKGISAIAGGVTEFLGVSDGLKDLTTNIDQGTLSVGNFITSIGEIAGAVGIASAAFTMAFGFPAGVVITAIVGAVAAIKGISDALNNIQTESIGNAIKDALTSPGGTPINEIASNFAEQINKVGDSFDFLVQKGGQVDDVDQDLINIKNDIDNMKIAMDDNVVSQEEGVTRLMELYTDLAQTTQEKFTLIEDQLTNAFGEGSYIGKIMEEIGVDVTGVKKAVVDTSEGVKTEIQALTDELNELYDKDARTAADNKRIQELESMIDSYDTGVDQIDTDIANLKNTAETTDIDWSQLIDADTYQVDVDKFSSSTQSLVDSVQDANGHIQDAYGTLRANLEEEIRQAEKIGDTENVAKLTEGLNAIPDAIDQSAEDVGAAFVTWGDGIQSDLVSKIGEVADNAEKEWNEMGPLQRLKNGGSEGAYVQEAVNAYKTGTIDPLAEQLESQYTDLGATGKTWASDAATEIINGMFDTTVTSDVTTGLGTVQTNLSDGWKTTLDNSVGTVCKTSAERAQRLADSERENMSNSLGNVDLSPQGEKVAHSYTDKFDSSMRVANYSDAAATQLQSVNDAFEDGADTTAEKNAQNVNKKYVEEFNNVGEDYRDQYKAVGEYTVEGVGEGAEEATPEVAEKTSKGLFDSIVDKIKSIFGIGSPAKEMHPYGKYILEGVLEGFTEAFGEIQTSVNGFFDKLKGIFSSDNTSAVFSGVKDGITKAWADIQTNTTTTWTTIQTTLSSIWTTLQTTASTTWTNIQTQISTVTTTVQDTLSAVWSGLKDTLAATWSDLKTFNDDTWNAIQEKINTVSDALNQKIKDIWTAIQKKITDVWKAVKEDTSKKWSEMKDNTSKTAQTMFETLRDKFKNMEEAAKTSFQNMNNTVKSMMENAHNTVKDFVQRIKDAFNVELKFPHIKLPHIHISGSFSLDPPSAPEFSIDWYKTGGFPEDGLFMANHNELVGKFSNGRTAVANNEQITDGIALAVERSIESTLPQILQRYVNNGGDTVIRIGDEDIARAASRGQRKLDKRYNPSIQIG